jgi:hypothetical protein
MGLSNTLFFLFLALLYTTWDINKLGGGESAVKNFNQTLDGKFQPNADH